MMRRITRFAAMLVLSSQALGFAWAAPGTYTEGMGYDRLAVPQAVSPKGKIVVTEFFWYNCPHCAEFEPEFEAWAKRQPADVAVERVPVAFAPQFQAQQKLYYALKVLGKADALQGAIFHAVHDEHVILQTPEQMATWLQAHGVSKQAFLSAFNSFGVQMEAKRATQMVTDYQISGVPSMAVQGTYVLSAALPQTPTNAKVLDAVDAMVAKVRAAGGAR